MDIGLNAGIRLRSSYILSVDSQYMAVTLKLVRKEVGLGAWYRTLHGIIQYRQFSSLICARIWSFWHIGAWGFFVFF